MAWRADGSDPGLSPTKSRAPLLPTFSGNWARWTAVFFCMVNAITQVAFITVFPLWTILIVTLDIIVIYQLTARWEGDYYA